MNIIFTELGHMVATSYLLSCFGGGRSYLSYSYNSSIGCQKDFYSHMFPGGGPVVGQGNDGLMW
jgi:hypothetical protein